jgi:hypothetical protein
MQPSSTPLDTPRLMPLVETYSVPLTVVRVVTWAKFGSDTPALNANVTISNSSAKIKYKGIDGLSSFPGRAETFDPLPTMGIWQGVAIDSLKFHPGPPVTRHC